MKLSRSILVLPVLACLLGGFLASAEEKKAPAPVKTNKQVQADRKALFDKPTVLDITIELDKKELEALRQQPRQCAKATLKVGDKVYPKVGVHIKGAAGSYRGIDDKPGLTVNMNKFGEKKLFFGMDKFHLANSVQDSSYVAELICGELFRAAGVPASRVSHTTLTINGRKRGFYYLKEGYDRYFLRQHFGNSTGNFYDGGFLRDIDQPLQLVRHKEGVKDRSDLKALVAASREPKPDVRMQKLGQVLDLDRFLSFLVLESITWDWDGYPMKCNNYRIYNDPKQKKLVFIPSGMDQMFGDPNGAMLPWFQGMVAHGVVDAPEGQKRYYVRMAEIRSEVFDLEKLNKRLDEVEKVITPALTAIDKGAGRDFPNQIKRVKQAMADRAKSIDKQMKAKFGDRWILFDPPGEFSGGQELALSQIRFFPEKKDGKATGKLYWRRKGETKFAELPLKSSGVNRFEVTLPATVTKAPFEYYLEVSEGENKSAHEPKQGPKAPRLATPDLTPPSIVPELAATSAKSYRVALGWKAATDDRKVVGYRVYRGPADKFEANEKTLLAKLSADDLRFADDAPPAKRMAWYAVRAIDVVGREGELRYLRVEVPDHQPPENRLKVKASPSANSILVEWGGDWDQHVSAIEVHRGEGDKGEMKKVGEVTDLKTPYYLDKDAKVGTDYRYCVRPRSNVGLTGELGKSATASPLRFLKRINCGGPKIEAEDGVPWEADNGDGHPSLKYSGSNVWTIGDKVKTDVFQSERWAGSGLGYELKIEPGRYEIVLLFAETNTDFAGKGKRLFDIHLDGKKVAEKVDVFTEAGGRARPWRYRKVIEVTGEKLEIKLLANPVGPAIKGIEIRGLAAK